MDDKEMRHMLDNLRLIHGAYDANGEDLSAWPWKAADEIERLHERCHPSKVVMIGGAGHYVSEAVAAEIQRLRTTLEWIATSNWQKWDEEVRSADDFVEWAKSRARHALTPNSVIQGPRSGPTGMESSTS